MPSLDLKDHDILTGRFQENKERNELLFHHWYQGDTIRDTADLTGVPEGTIIYYFAKFNRAAKKGSPLMMGYSNTGSSSGSGESKLLTDKERLSRSYDKKLVKLPIIWKSATENWQNPKVTLDQIKVLQEILRNLPTDEELEAKGVSRTAFLAQIGAPRELVTSFAMVEFLAKANEPIKGTPKQHDFQAPNTTAQPQKKKLTMKEMIESDPYTYFEVAPMDADRFTRCSSCGGTAHRYRDCPQKGAFKETMRSGKVPGNSTSS